MSNIHVRRATAADLPCLVALFADDELGRLREDPSLPLKQCYVDAFKRIDGDDNNQILVACEGDDVIGTLQITFTQYLSRMGCLRATIESVHVAHDKRDLGVGTILLNYAIDLAKQRGCSLVQLTTDKTRTRAHRFYERLGFEATHEGMKLHLDQ